MNNQKTKIINKINGKIPASPIIKRKVLWIPCSLLAIIPDLKVLYPLPKNGELKIES